MFFLLISVSNSSSKMRHGALSCGALQASMPSETAGSQLPENQASLYEPAPLVSGSKDILLRAMTGGRGRGRRGPGRAVTMIRQQNKRDMGYKFRPEKLPPDFVERPWNAFTFSAVFDGAGVGTPIEITSAMIRDNIRGKIGIAATGKIALKVEKARVWATSVGPEFVYPYVRLGAYETQSDSAGRIDQRMTVADHGALSDPARVAYYWPLADRKNILSPSSSIAFMEMTGSVGLELTVMVNVLWFASPATSFKEKHETPSLDLQTTAGDLSEYDLGDSTPKTATSPCSVRSRRIPVV